MSREENGRSGMVEAEGSKRKDRSGRVEAEGSKRKA